MSDIDLIIQARVDGIKQVSSLSASLKQLNTSVKGVFVPMSKLDSQTRALNKALGMGTRGAKEHATSLKGLVSNQRVLAEETKRLTKDIRAMQSLMAKGQKNQLINPQTIGALKEMRLRMTGLRLRAFSSDIQNVGLKLKKLGKDAQFVGRSLMINLTAPIALFARFGLQALREYDRESVRLTKVLDNVAMSAEQAMAKTGIPDENNAKVQELVQNFNFLDQQLLSTSQKFGIARSLATGLAADFAELGISTGKNIAAITRLTAATEKLGGMDISDSQELIQAMYFQSVRAFESAGRAFETAADREAAAISSATANLQMFNAIENVTALTLRDIGAAFPEVASMATTFGLSMIEAAAMLAPMKAAGLNVGASANAIKVSLQRLVAPTKQNEELMKRLSKSYADTAQGSQAFENATKSGLTGLLGIVEAFEAVRTETGGLEGPMQLMSKIFGVRQGPRMMIAIQQLADFDAKLRGIGPNATSVEKRLADMASAAANNSKLMVENFTDIGVIARVATAQIGQEVEGFGKVNIQDIKDAQAARKAVGEEILRAQREGVDLMSEISTEAGRAMITQLAGASSASAIANRELDQALGSLDVTINVLKNNFKIFASDLIKNLRPTIERISELSSELLAKWQALGPEVRERIGKLVIAVAGALAAIGPLILAFGTLSSVTGIAMRGFFKLAPSLKNAQGGFIGLTEAGKKLGDVYKKTGDRFDSLYAKFIQGKGAVNTATMQIGSAAQSATASGQLMRKGSKIVDTGTGAAVPLRSKAARAFAQEEFFLMQRTGMARGQGAPGYSSRRIASGRTLPNKLISDAIAARQAGFEKAGITRSATGALMRGGFQVSESRGLAMARGGVRGRLARVASMATNIRTAPGAVANVGLSKLGTVVKNVSGYQAALNRVTIAQKDLNFQSLAFGTGAPSSFAKATTAIKAFTGAQAIATIGAKALKIALLSTGIGIVFAAIGVAIYAVVKNFDTFKKIAQSGMTQLRKAWATFKSAIMEVIRPFVDLFALFGEGSEGGVGAAEALGKAFNKIGEAVNYVAKLFAAFVRNVIQPYLYAIINIVMAVVSAFQGNWGKALDFLQAGFAFAMEAVINLVAAGVKLIIKAFFLLAKGIVKAIGFGLKIALEMVFSFVTLTLKALSEIPFADKIFGPVEDKFRGVMNNAKGLIDAGTDGINKGIGIASDAITGGIDSLAKGIKGAVQGMKKGGIEKSIGKVFKDSKPAAKKAGEELGKDAAEAITNATGEELEQNGAEKIGKAFKDAIKDLRQKLVDYVLGELEGSLKNVIKQTEDALKKQKEAALKVYDDQISTLEKLEKAEESLTRTKEYETQRRQMIEERALQFQNYQRNRALAIYEGRIDDARVLDLEEIRNAKDSQRQIEGLDSERRKELAKENLDALRDAIQKAKEAADEMYDYSIEKFQKAADEITKIPPATTEQYAEQLKKLQDLAANTAEGTGAEFKKMLEEFATNINTIMPNKGIPAFTTSLDQLVKVAQDKYGLGKTTGDNNTIIGLTIGMLTGMSGSIVDNRGFITDNFGEIATDMKGSISDASNEITTTILTTFFTEYKKVFDEADLGNVLPKAIADGNKTLQNEFLKTVDSVHSGVKNISSALDPLLIKWAQVEAAAKAAADAQAAAGGGGGGASGGPTTPSAPYIPGYGGIAENPIIVSTAKTNPLPATRPKTPAPAAIIRDATGRIIAGPTGGFTARGYGGRIKRMAVGGYLNSPVSQSIPALLHGGEYIMSAKAVQRIGLGTLTALNNTRFMTPRKSQPSGVANVTMSTKNTNIYVENFIGEEEWFKSMMKEYNINTLPKSQKAAGVESRVIRTYNGINQGL